MGGAIDVRVNQGLLKIACEILVASSKEELEEFISEIYYKLLGSRKLPSSSLIGKPVSKELTEHEAAIYIGRSINFLRKCRMAKYAGDKNFQGPQYTRFSERNIRYSIEELDKWLASRMKMTNNAKYEMAEVTPKSRRRY
ncbi:hypothetical protein AGMMS49957_16700 [Synergistales bacterium]|nr:hypothetical protein AGMMS49957_16700 [Synergistales bacterium]